MLQGAVRIKLLTGTKELEELIGNKTIILTLAYEMPVTDRWVRRKPRKIATCVAKFAVSSCLT